MMSSNAYPLRRALDAYIDKKQARFHMPGHKGELSAPFSEIAPYDLTELPDTDNLYSAAGAILESENRLSALYNTGHSFFSTGGSSQCIAAMLRLVYRENGVILCTRNLHVAAVNAMGLLGLRALFTGAPLPDKIECVLKKRSDIAAVYVTSPDYYGRLADIRAIADVCSRYNVPFLVDNAHGAHLLAFSLHPMALGATMCCDSAHKTLPALTGGAYLHISREASGYIPHVRAAMGLFGSTSPSYPIMLSLEHAHEYLSSGGTPEFRLLGEYVEMVKERMTELGFILPQAPSDPVRLTFSGTGLGIDGRSLSLALRERKIETEYADDMYVVLIPAPHRLNDLDRLLAVLEEIAGDCRGEPVNVCEHEIPCSDEPVKLCVLERYECVPVDDAVGRIAAVPVYLCPPGVPILLPGESVDKKIKEILKNTGIYYINVI